MFNFWPKTGDYVHKRIKESKPKRNKQSRLPKKPRFEPPAKIIPGNHPIVFENGKGQKKKEVVRK